MREAMGSSWLLGIAAIFIALFCTFLAVSINYTKAFNLKNSLINAIEKNEGFKTSASYGSTSIQEKIEKDIFETSGYMKLPSGSGSVRDQYRNACRSPLGLSSASSIKDGPGGDAVLGKYAYCVRRVCQGSGSSYRGCYYKVVTFASIEIPIVGFYVKVPISGETKTIYCDANDNSGGKKCNNTGCVIR